MVQILHHTELNIFHMSANNNKTISFYITSIPYFSSLQAAKKAYDIKKCAAVSARVARARTHTHTHTHTHTPFQLLNQSTNHQQTLHPLYSTGNQPSTMLLISYNL
jgi:hypothetical protein